MKSINCYDCEEQFQAESREEMLGILYEHYMKDHKEIITGVSGEEKKVWMERFDRDWNAE